MVFIPHTTQNPILQNNIYIQSTLTLRQVAQNIQINRQYKASLKSNLEKKRKT